MPAKHVRSDGKLQELARRGRFSFSLVMHNWTSGPWLEQLLHWINVRDPFILFGVWGSLYSVKRILFLPRVMWAKYNADYIPPGRHATQDFLPLKRSYCTLRHFSISMLRLARSRVRVEGPDGSVVISHGLGFIGLRVYRYTVK